ncbi:hypothetical protein QQP08_012675 [Theobroma cacao]|nr:hypothetical protein QQP08_012675 [Theobroma cacao]
MKSEQKARLTDIAFCPQLIALFLNGFFFPFVPLLHFLCALMHLHFPSPMPLYFPYIKTNNPAILYKH